MKRRKSDWVRLSGSRGGKHFSPVGSEVLSFMCVYVCVRARECEWTCTTPELPISVLHWGRCEAASMTDRGASSLDYTEPGSFCSRPHHLLIWLCDSPPHLHRPTPSVPNPIPPSRCGRNGAEHRSSLYKLARPAVRAIRTRKSGFRVPSWLRHHKRPLKSELQPGNGGGEFGNPGRAIQYGCCV